MSGNSITIVGNITRDPELRFTPSGQANARLGVAVNRRWQDRSSGEWNEATSFFDVICWRELAENVSESLKRGTRVIVTGRLEQRTWEQEGNKRSVVEILGNKGDLVDVTPGYARNYLVPKGLAVAATGGVTRQAEAMRRSRQVR